jgi:hypothetical protein
LISQREAIAITKLSLQVILKGIENDPDSQ